MVNLDILKNKHSQGKNEGSRTTDVLITGDEKNSNHLMSYISIKF